MISHRQLATLLLAALTLGCNSKSAPAPAAAPAPKPSVMDAATRAADAKAAAEHPAFKVFLQKLDHPAIVVVDEKTTDDQLKNLLWYLRTEIREGKYKELGLQPTAALFDKPGYSSGTINIYRGAKCAKEMYTTSGPDPCGPSIHKAAAYHWGDGGDRRADGGDIVTANGRDTLIFTADDGWQTDEEAQKDPTGLLRKEAAARIRYSFEQTNDMVNQHSDIRFYIDDPDDVLNVVSRQFLVEATMNSFLTQFKVLELDHACALHFKAITLIPRGQPGKTYPLDCSNTPKSGTP